MVTPIDVFMLKFTKFVRWEIDEIMHYLPDKKMFGCLSNCLYCMDHAQNLPGPASNNVLTMLQVSSKSLTFGGVITECMNTIC